MRKTRGLMLVPVVLLAAVAAGAVWMETGVPGQDRGIPAEELLEHTRERAGVPEDWAYAEDLTDTAYAVLFYDPENPTDCTFRFCMAREGEEGYFTRGGGNLSEVRDGITVYTLRDTPDRAVVSANTPQAARITAPDGTDVEVDPDAPFVLLLPQDGGELTITDDQGEEISYNSRDW